MRMRFIFLILFFLGKTNVDAFTEEENLTRRIHAHLAVQDYFTGCEEAEQALQLHPQSVALHEAFIRALAKLGEEKKLVKAWDTYIHQFPDKAMNRELIEEMAWGILYKAWHSS